tara:strand:+ start:532 stop:1233 length:702 start_codon:yes stop_codon:yes gene_type:complete
MSETAYDLMTEIQSYQLTDDDINAPLYDFCPDMIIDLSHIYGYGYRQQLERFCDRYSDYPVSTKIKNFIIHQERVLHINPHGSYDYEFMFSYCVMEPFKKCFQPIGVIYQLYIKFKTYLEERYRFDPGDWFTNYGFELFKKLYIYDKIGCYRTDIITHTQQLLDIYHIQDIDVYNIKKKQIIKNMLKNFYNHAYTKLGLLDMHDNNNDSNIMASGFIKILQNKTLVRQLVEYL